MTVETARKAYALGYSEEEPERLIRLPDNAEWERFEAARRAMSGRLSNAVPASRYNIADRQSA